MPNVTNYITIPAVLQAAFKQWQAILDTLVVFQIFTSEKTNFEWRNKINNSNFPILSSVDRKNKGTYST